MSAYVVRTFLLCLSLFMSLCVPALAEPVMLDLSNPPFMYGGEGKVMGVYPALLGEAFKKMGIPLEMEAVPWKRAIAAIDEGKAGVGGIYKNDERLKKYDYSDKLFDEVIQVYARKGAEFAFTDVASLTGKKIGVLRGWSYGDDFDAAAKAGKITIDEAEGDGQNFAKLAAGRIDAVLAVRESGDINMASPETAKAVVALATPLSSSPSFLAFNKSANKSEILAKFNAALAQMKADGSFDTLVKSILSAK